MIHFFSAEKQGDKVPQALEEDSVSVLVIEIERHLAHHRIEVDKFARLGLELVREAVLKLLLKLIGAVC